MLEKAHPARVLLVGFEDQDNLGLRYLSSRLKHSGHAVRLVTVSGGPEPVLEAVRELAPHIVGVSLIFQYLVPQFASLLSRLRSAGVVAHFTIGGHYASFEPELLFESIPELDSIVRWEGENTLLDLAEQIANDREWRNVPGIAFKDNKEVKFTAPRSGLANLDELPWPDRDDIDYRAQQLPTASVLGGRGCPWRCSFCSIITFYEGNGTKGRRRRDPAIVVDELEYLHRERGVRVILWQDDDFLAGGKAAVRWAHAIARECMRRGLDADLRWKISCRSDEVSRESLEPLVAAGLTHVYMGIEFGDPDDLKHFNKHLGPEKHLRAGEILRELGLSFDFGFMLFQPWSTIDTVRNNLHFLRKFAGDGATPIAFCRTLPYAGTPLEDRLKAEGRVRERDFHADYQFLNSRLDLFYDWTLSAFADRNHSASGTANLLRLLLFDAKLNLPGYALEPQLAERVQKLSAISNQLLLDTAEIALDHIESRSAVDANDETLAMLESYHASEDSRLREDLRGLTYSGQSGGIQIPEQLQALTA